MKEKTLETFIKHSNQNQTHNSKGQNYENIYNIHNNKNTEKMNSNRHSDLSKYNEVPSTKEILLNISYTAFPVALSFVCILLQQTVVLSFLGHKYNNQFIIEGIGISNVYVNCSLLSVINGLTSAFDTFGANSLGVKNMKVFGYYYHKTLLISFSVGISILIFNFLFAVRIIAFCGLNAEIMFFCEQYIQILMFYVLFDIVFLTNFRYLNLVNMSYMNVVILVITLFFHPIWSYLTITVFDFGIKGGAISLVFTQFLNALFSSLWVLYYSPYPDSIFFFTKESFEKWSEYIKLSLPATFLYCAEVWAFEIFALIALWCSDFDFSVFILINNVAYISYCLAVGFSTSVTLLVGEYISVNNIEAIKKIKLIAIIYGVSVMFFNSILIFIFRREIFRLFIDDEAIIELGQKCLKIICFAQILDLYQTIYQGYFRGVGKHFIASLLCFSNFYILMLGFSVLFAKVMGYGAFGLVFSYLLSELISSIAYTVIETYFDYDELYKEALERVTESPKPCPSNAKIYSRNISFHYFELKEEDLNDKEINIEMKAYN